MNEKTKKRLSPMKKRPRSDSEEAYVSREELDIKNPMPQLNVPPSYTTKGTNGDRIVIVMVGLPARGKTYMVRAKTLFFSISEFSRRRVQANRITRYLSFFHGAIAKVFNVGNYRRKINGAVAMHDFFDDKNQDGMAIRLRSGTYEQTTQIKSQLTHTNTQHDLQWMI